MSDDLLAHCNEVGGSLEEKLQAVVDTFRTSARHLESLQQVLRRRALERREKNGEEHFPAEVEEVIAQGSYLETFLQTYDGKSFPLYSEEIVPCHSYRLALEVHSGGAYWSGVPVQDAGAVRQQVETVGASSSVEGSASIVSQYGAGQRGAVFVWRWNHMLDSGPYNIPEWLSRALGTEGNDPLRKLQSELETIRRWEQQVRQETAKHVKQGTEVKDPYIREVLRLWPTEPDPHGGEQLKKCAWVEGLDPRLFVGRTVVVCRVPYDVTHGMTLHAVIAKRHADEGQPTDSNPPFRLTSSWQWASGVSGDAANAAAATGLGSRVNNGTAASLTTSEMMRPGTAASLNSEMTRPGSVLSEMTRPGTMQSDIPYPAAVDEKLASMQQRA